MIQQKQILIVEDNEPNRAMLREILSAEYNVLEAENGQAALKILKDSKEDVALILLDVMMPEMDGYTFLDIVQNDKELSLIPVIVMTQDKGEDEEVNALSHGATDFVPKPYRPQVIMHRVASIIKLRETAALVNQFQYDRLTGLYTKEFFYQKVRETLDDNPDKEYTIISTNLENFKLYNDTFGRKEGDRLLVKSAEILKKRVGRNAICCRYAADRFLCLQEKEREQRGRAIFAKRRSRHNSQPEYDTPVKLGIYEITDRSISVEQMCDRALMVVDSIKGIYDKHFAVYDDTLRDRLHREKDITDAMDSALKEDQFVIYYQPEYSLNDNRMIGAEALVRWNHPEWGLMSPAQFIPFFEKNGFISFLDEYVWEQVCRQLREWKNKGYPIIPVSVNISRADIFRFNLVEKFVELIHRYDLQPDWLRIEITETAYTESPEQIVSTSKELGRCGFIIEMDDFGSGYSSLNALGQMSLDVVKLDMNFVWNEVDKPVEKSMLSDVINMAHRMHLNVIAEGVETKDNLKRLQAVGCDFAQGFFFSKPIPAEEFECLLRTQCNQEIVELSHSEDERPNLIVIDADSSYREKVKKYFGEMYRIREADNAAIASEIVSECNPDNIHAILLSLILPENGAAVFMERLRQNPAFWKIPVISTSPCLQIVEEMPLALDSDDMICNNFPMGELHRRIERLADLAAYRKRENLLQNKANQDYLTGLLNRRGLQEAMDSLRKDELPMAFCMFDVDDLKTANDNFGHEAGDHLIKSFAELLLRKTRKDDIQCRYGGDEFVVILKNIKTPENAVKKCTEICEEFIQQMQEGGPRAASSCGVAICSTDEVPSSAFIEKADKAMYHAKEENRGRCCLYGE